MFATDEAFGRWWTLVVLLDGGRSGQVRPRDVQG
jgi:hypothetical protein